MAVIGVGGEKGGCGKSTFTVNLATYLAYKGHTVGILDADKKPHSKAWSERRGELTDLPQVACKRGTGEIDATIKAMANDYDFVIVDCGGVDAIEMRFAMAFGDIFLTPFNTSYFDVDTAQNVNSIVKEAKVFNPDLKAKALFVSAPNNKNSVSRKRAADVITVQSDLDLLNSCTHNLEVYRQTIMDGKAVMDTSHGKARTDMRLIAEELEL